MYIYLYNKYMYKTSPCTRVKITIKGKILPHVGKNLVYICISK